MTEFIKIRNSKLGNEIVKALNKRNFEAYFVEDKESALKKAISLIAEKDIVSWGGSLTLNEIGLINKLKELNYKVIDRDSAKTPEERRQLMCDALTCDTFLMSSNAITQDGQLFNIDAVGNRLAALCFGPKNVLIIAGMNKIVNDLDEAYSKVRNYTAPVNSQRFSDTELPCLLKGECFNCQNENSICCEFLTTRLSKPAKRIKVILVNESLGI